MNQMGCGSEESGLSIADATERPNNTLMGKSATFLSGGDSEPASKGVRAQRDCRNQNRVPCAGVGEHRVDRRDTRARNSGKSSRHQEIPFGKSNRHGVSLIMATSEQGRRLA